MTDRDFSAQLAGYSLTTAEILYRLPDHPSLLQSFIWQDYDVHPRFPRLKRLPRFLDAQPGGQALPRDGGAQKADHASRGEVDRRRLSNALTDRSRFPNSTPPRPRAYPFGHSTICVQRNWAIGLAAPSGVTVASHTCVVRP